MNEDDLSHDEWSKFIVWWEMNEEDLLYDQDSWWKMKIYCVMKDSDLLCDERRMNDEWWMMEIIVWWRFIAWWKTGPIYCMLNDL